MTLLTPQGVITYSRGELTDFYSSTIDLTFASPAIATRSRGCYVVDVPGFETDHRPIQTRLNMLPNQEVTRRLLWKKVDKKEFSFEVQ